MHFDVIIHRRGFVSNLSNSKSETWKQKFFPGLNKTQNRDICDTGSALWPNWAMKPKMGKQINSSGFIDDTLMRLSFMETEWVCNSVSVSYSIECVSFEFESSTSHEPTSSHIFLAHSCASNEWVSWGEMSMEVVVDQNLWTQIELQYEFYHEKNTHSYPFEDGILNKVIFHDYFAD